MKKVLLIVLYAIVWQSSFASDIDAILTKSREQIQCIIVSQDDSVVSYRSIDPNDTIIHQIAHVDVEKVYVHTEEIRKIQYNQESKPKTVKNDIVKQQLLAPKPVAEKIEAPTNPQIAFEEPISLAKDTDINQRMTEPEQAVAVTNKADISKKAKQTKSKKDYSDANKEFKSFMGVLTGAIPDIYESNNLKENDTIEKTISIYVLGLRENEDIRRIIENELSSKLSMIDEYTGLVCQSPIGATEDSIIQLARNNDSKMICVVDVMPFQEKYYVQTNIINIPTNKKIASASTAADLSTLDGIITSTNELSAELVKRFETVQTKAKEKKNHGNSWSVPGRKLIGSLPPIANIFNQEGIVVVKIHVNEDGDVTKAQCIKGTTIKDQDTLMLAIEAVFKARFHRAERESVGTITYVFKLN